MNRSVKEKTHEMNEFNLLRVTEDKGEYLQTLVNSIKTTYERSKNPKYSGKVNGILRILEDWELTETPGSKNYMLIQEAKTLLGKCVR